MDLIDAKRYLLGTGWHVVETSQRLVRYQTRVFGEDFEFSLPRDSRSFQETSNDLLSLLSFVEDRDVAQIIIDISNVEIDKMCFAIPTESADLNVISLDTAIDFLAQLKRVYQHTARTENKLEVRHVSLNKKSREFTKICEFAHTSAGSFAFNVDSPIFPRNSQPLPLGVQSIAFRRRVTQRLANSLQALEFANARNRPDIIFENIGLAMNGNICDELKDLIEKSKMESFTASFFWSNKYSVKKRLYKRMKIHKSSINVLEKVSSYFSEIDPGQRVSVSGSVLQLKYDFEIPPALSGAGSGEVVVDWKSKSGSLKVAVLLEADQYNRALDAHRNGRHIFVTGVMRKFGRKLRIDDVDEFDVSGSEL